MIYDNFKKVDNVIRFMPLGDPVRCFISLRINNSRDEFLASYDVPLDREINAEFDLQVNLLMQEHECTLALLYYQYKLGQIFCYKDYTR